MALRKNTKLWKGCRIIGMFIHCWGNGKLNNYFQKKKKKQFLAKLKIHLLGIPLQDKLKFIFTANLFANVSSGFVHNCQKRKQLVLQLVNDTLWDTQAMEYYSDVYKEIGIHKQYIFENEMKNIHLFLHIKSWWRLCQ